MKTVSKPAFVLIAAAMLAAATAVPAEPPKAPAKNEAPRTNHPAQVMLASAEQVATTAAPAEQVTPQPPKHRTARVTTCRCGDQVAEQPDQ